MEWQKSGNNISSDIDRTQEIPISPQQAPQPQVSYCSYCGTPLPAGSMFCNNCGAPTNHQAPQVIYVAPPPEPDRKGAGYIIISYLFFGLFLLVGITNLCLHGVQANAITYKRFIICASAFVFLPQVKVKSGSPYIAFFIKLMAALLICLLL